MDFAADKSFFTDQNATSDETTAFVDDDRVMNVAYFEIIKASDITSQSVTSGVQQGMIAGPIFSVSSSLTWMMRQRTCR